VEPIKNEKRGQFFLMRLSFSKSLLFKILQNKEMAEESFRNVLELAEKALPPFNAYTSITKD